MENDQAGFLHASQLGLDFSMPSFHEVTQLCKLYSVI